MNKQLHYEKTGAGLFDYNHADAYISHEDAYCNDAHHANSSLIAMAASSPIHCFSKHDHTVPCEESPAAFVSLHAQQQQHGYGQCYHDTSYSTRTAVSDAAKEERDRLANEEADRKAKAVAPQLMATPAPRGACMLLGSSTQSLVYVGLLMLLLLRGIITVGGMHRHCSAINPFYNTFDMLGNDYKQVVLEAGEVPFPDACAGICCAEPSCYAWTFAMAPADFGSCLTEEPCCYLKTEGKVDPNQNPICTSGTVDRPPATMTLTETLTVTLTETLTLTEKPSTAVPTTEKPSTAVPTTKKPSTAAPTTPAPTPAPTLPTPAPTPAGLPFQRSIVLRRLEDRSIVTLQMMLLANSTKPWVHFQQAFTGAAFTQALIGSTARCNFIIYNTSKCFVLNDCMPAAELSTSGQRLATPGLIDVPERTFGSHSTIRGLRIVLGASTLANPSCHKSSVLTAAVVQSSQPFLTIPLYHPAQLIGVGSPGGDAMLLHASINATDAAGVLQVRNLFLSTLNDAPTFINPVLSKGHVSTVLCTIPDVSAFDKRPLNASDNLGLLYAMDCGYDRKVATGADLQAACATEEQCLGAVTTADGDPLCLLRAGLGLDPFFGGEGGRWLLTKPAASNRTCTVSVANSGNIAILIQQTSLAFTTVVVYIDSRVVAQCGETRLFAGRLFGRSSACSQWRTCFDGKVLANDTVRVLYSATATAGGCNASAGVLFEARFDEQEQTRPPEILMPQELSTANLTTTFPHRLVINVLRREFINVFVSNAQQAILTVAQTGFDCSRTPLKACTRAAVNLSVQSVVAQQCGGTSPFLRNISGVSDQWTQPRFCGPPVEIFTNGTTRLTAFDPSNGGFVQVPDDSLFLANEFEAATEAIGPPAQDPAGYTGWLTLTVDTPMIRSASSLSQLFTAVLRTSSGQHHKPPLPLSAFSGFPLSIGAGRFALLAAPRLKSALAAALRNWSYALVAPALAAVLGQEDPRLCLLITSPAASMPDAAAAFWNEVGGVNASFACIMDWISTDSGVCIIPVPPGATFAKIQVGQTNYVDDESIMEVSQLNNASKTVLLTQCGGSRRFSGQPSRAEQCSTFLSCGSGFLDENTSFIRLSAPAAVGNSRSCTVAFAATVDFSYVEKTAPQVCPFQCRGDFSCVPLSSVCNGVVDCQDGSDEETCNAWVEIEANNIFVITPFTIVFAVQVFGDCRTAALRNQTRIFAIARNQTICIVYHPSNASEFFSNPSPYIEALPGFSTFASLGGDSYGRCSDESSCSGKGKVVSSSAVAGKLTCSCVCSSGFTSSDCSKRMELSSVGPIAVAFETSGGRIPTPGEVELALLQVSNSTDLQITCSPMIREQTRVLTTCMTSGPKSDVDALNALVLTPAAQAKLVTELNITAEALAPVTPSTQPLFQPAACTDDGNDTLICDVGEKPVRSFQVSVTASAGVNEIILQVTRRGISSTAHRAFYTMSTLRCIPENNNLYQTPTRSGCVTTVCFINSDDTTPVASASIVSGGNTQVETDTRSSDPCYATNLEITIPVLVPAVIKEHPVAVQLDLSPFLISCIVILIIGGILLTIASILLRNYFVDSAAAVGEMINEHALKTLLTITIRKMKFNHARNVRYEKYSTLLSILAFDMFIVGVFLALYYTTSNDYTSNVEVLIESYRTSSCDTSTLAPLATRVTLVPASSALSCLPRESTGLSTGTIYTAAFCDGSTGSLLIKVKIGSSLSDCNAMPVKSYPTGSCIKTSDLLPYVIDESYLLFQCGTVASVARRFAAFQLLNAEEPDGDITRPEVLPADRAQPSARGAMGEYLAMRVAQSVALLSTSNAQHRFESAAYGGDLLLGDQSPRRLVVQVEGEVFDSQTSGTVTAELENSSPLKLASHSSKALGPKDGDYPVGSLFNNFGLDKEASLAAAGPAAARYYGIRGSLADIGLHYDGSEHAGITISMYLRCTRRSAGFAFAVTDGREDMVLGTSPLLNRLMTMLANGSPASAWYNRTYNVYSGLFVDGPAMSISFVYANAVSDILTEAASTAGAYQRPDAVVSNLRWDLSALGLLRLFNGVWHHVAIIIRTENEETKVQLVVDGETSRSKKGWNQCPSTIPDPIHTLNPDTDVSVRNFKSERVVTDGILYTGYFNGGIAHLQFKDHPMPLFELWRGSTTAIRSHANFDESRYIVLGVVLLVAGIAMLVAMLVTSGREWRELEAHKQNATRDHCIHLYHALWRECPTDPLDIPYMYLPFELVFDYLNCDVETFTIFLEELPCNFKRPMEQLVRLLYHKVKADVNAAAAAAAGGNPSQEAVASPLADQEKPTAAEWRATIPEMQDASSTDDEEEEEGDGDAGDEDSGQIFVSHGGVTSQGNPLIAEGTDALAGSRDKATHLKPKRSNSRVLNTINAGRRKKHTANDQAMTVITAQATAAISVAGAGMAAGTRMAVSLPAVSVGFGRETAGSYGSPSAIVQSALGVLQSVTMWAAASTLPSGHIESFRTAFAAFSLEVSTLLSSPLVTPLVHCFTGLAIFGLLFFVIDADEKAFLWNLARYLVKRDAAEFEAAETAPSKKVDYLSEVDAEFDKLLGEFGDNGLIFTVPLMPVQQSQRIDDLVSGDKRRTLGSARTLDVVDDIGIKYTLEKPPSESDKLPVEALLCTSDETTTTPLRVLDHRCVLHNDRLLAPQMQTTVWPYRHRPTCIASVFGKRCGMSVGVMYVCAHTVDGGDADDMVQCKYALCEQHFRAPPHLQVLLPVIAMKRQITSRGTLWLVVTLVLVAANALYMPIMKTALSILACDPYYQCRFKNCWEAPDSFFILSAYLCFVIVGFFGIGFPFTMTFLLRRRKSMLQEIFFSDVYDGHFDDPLKPGIVNPDEWNRYVATDPTALGKLYLSYELKWIYLPPILLAWKAASIAPAVFIERDTFQQAVGIAAVEFAFGVFIFWTEASISPLVDFTYKFSAAHQMIFLGLIALNTRQEYAGATNLDALSVAVTMLYLLITGLIFSSTSVVPVVQNLRHKAAVLEMFTSFGMHYSLGTGYYVVPSADRKHFVRRDGGSDKAFGVSLRDSNNHADDQIVLGQSIRNVAEGQQRVSRWGKITRTGWAGNHASATSSADVPDGAEDIEAVYATSKTPANRRLSILAYVLALRHRSHATPITPDIEGRRVFTLHSLLAQASPRRAVAEATRIINTPGTAICHVTAADPMTALLTSAFHHALTAGVTCPPRCTRKPIVVVVAATAEAAEAAHQAAVLLCHSAADAHGQNQLPYITTAGLLTDETSLSYATKDILQSGVSPVVIGTFTRITELVETRALQCKSATTVVLIDAHTLTRSDTHSVHPLWKLMEHFGRSTQIVCTCRPDAYQALKAMCQWIIPARGMLARVLEHDEAHETIPPPPIVTPLMCRPSGNAAPEQRLWRYNKSDKNTLANEASGKKGRTSPGPSIEAVEDLT